MTMQTRLAKLETAEHERLCSEVRAAEDTLKALVEQLFTEEQVRALDILWTSGDTEVRELDWCERQGLYETRRQQASLEQLRRMLAGHRWAAVKLRELLAERKPNETT